MKFYYLLNLIILFCSYFFTADCFRCFFCSYFQLENGTKVMPHALWDDYKLTPFCGDFYPNNVNTVDSIEGGCCSVRKMKVIDEDTNETMWLSEHSIAAQIDNPRWNYTCPEEIGTYECRTEHMRAHHHSHQYEDDGTVCHCNEDLCNVAIQDNKAAQSNNVGFSFHIILLSAQIYIFLFD